MDGIICEVKFALPGMIVHSNNSEQRGFSGSRRSHDREKLALRDFQVDLPQHVSKPRLGPITFLNALQLDQRLVDFWTGILSIRFLPFTYHLHTSAPANLRSLMNLLLSLLEDKLFG